MTEIKSKALLTANTIVAMVLVVTVELMFFVALFSAYLVNRAVSGIPWPPPDQPRLPEEMTMVNTAVLLLSAVILVLGLRKVKKSENATPYLWATVLMGIAFVSIQGFEWIKMLRYGYSIEAVGIFASFYYTLIGAHALHAVIGILVSLVIVSLYSFKGITEKRYNQIGAMSIYWIFVVAVWPFIYYIIYML